jgi:uncharacterized repeat protein (TIGR01451 family)
VTPKGEKQETTPQLLSAPAIEVESATDFALARLEPALREAAQGGGDEQVLALVIARSDDADLSLYGEIISKREVEQLGVRHVFMRVPARNLLKLASHPAVSAVTGYESQPRPELPALAAQKEHGRAPNAPSSWFENDYQGVNQTWGVGVFGTGDVGNNIKIGIIDSGVDFCNPALMNRWAVEWGGTPWDGWPIAYDDRSAADFMLNFPGPGSGFNGNWGWYVNAGFAVFDQPPGMPTPFNDPAFGAPFMTPGTSMSGQYQLGYHPDATLQAILGPATTLLVADTTFPGVYDTVYADANGSGFFGDPGDVIMTQASPAGCADWTIPDGVPDISYGLLYWIADGANPLPGVETTYGPGTPPPAPGTVLMFMIDDFTEPNGTQGTLAASTAAGYDNSTLVDWKGIQAFPAPGDPSLVQGPASGGLVVTPTVQEEGARIVAIGNHYAGSNPYNEYLFTVFGYNAIPDGMDDPSIVTLPYDKGSEDAEAWDFESEYLAALNLYFPDPVGLHSPIYVNAVGDGGYGYGTVNSPSPDTGVHVGASTQYGPYYYRYPYPEGWGEYEGVSASWQANTQDVAPFSNRGPTAMSTLAPHVVANGSQGSGAMPLNWATFAGGGGDGTTAWEVWEGSGRSTAVVAGMLALVYDAYWQGTMLAGAPIFPTWRQARQFLMNGARATSSVFWPSDLHYDEKVAGAGQANAYRATAVAHGALGVYVDPPYYDAGSFPPGSGQRYESFAHGLYPGDVETKVFTVYNPTSNPVFLELWDEQLQEINRYDYTLSTISGDPSPSNYEYGAPDYLLDLTSLISDNAGADLMVVRVAYPFEHFGPDPNNPPSYANQWVGAIYNVFDDGDGVWWNDVDMNGRVEITQTGALNTELDRDDEFIRISFSELAGTAQEMRMRDPLERSAWWLNGGNGSTWLGLSHLVNDGTSTDLHIEVMFYNENDWEQVSVVPITLTLPPGTVIAPTTANFTATIAAVTMGTDYFSDYFESGFGNWAASGLWHHVSSADPCQDYHTFDSSAGYHTDPACNYNTGGPNSGALTLLQPVFLPAGIPIAQLSFWSHEETDCWGADWWWNGWTCDERRVEASRDGVNWDLLWTSNGGSVENTWYNRAVDLNPYIGGPVWIRFVFNGDGTGDTRAGWYVDDVRIRGPVDDDAYGEHMGRIIVNDSTEWPVELHEVVIPIQKQVWFTTTVDPVVGGTPRAITPYDNGHVYGAMDWDGNHPESGDWRFYAFMVDEDVPDGSIIMVDNVWEDDPTDIDSLILAPAPTWDFSTVGNPALTPPAPPYPAGWFGPYTLDDLGYGSARVTGASGRPSWVPQTNTGAPTHEFVTAPAEPGLHVLAHHTVLYGGEQVAVPFTTTIGLASITPNPVVLNGLTCISCTVPIVFKSGLPFTDGLYLGGEFGWYQPYETDDFIAQGGNWVRNLTLADYDRLFISTQDITGTPDLDLYLYQDGGNGTFDSNGGVAGGDDVLIATSGSAYSDEYINTSGLPAGDYFVEVYGFSVVYTLGQFNISIKQVTGGDAMSVYDLPPIVQPNVPYTLSLHIDAPPDPGTWEGLLLFGPSYATQAIQVPVTIYQGEGQKEALQDEVRWGELITYTIAVTAAAGAPTNTYTVSDPIPAGTQLVYVAGATYDPGPPAVVTWTGTLSDGLAHVITLTVQAATPTGWLKWVDGVSWTEGMSRTVETLDTIEIVDVISVPFAVELYEFWYTDTLRLISYTVEGGAVVTEDDSLVWTGSGDVMTLTKLFQAEPCTWTETLVSEYLVVGGGPLTNTAWVDSDWQSCPLTETVLITPVRPSVIVQTRPVTINHQLPDLHISSDYVTNASAGHNAAFTLVYSNTGGYETNVWITNTFPISAPFVSSNPAATRQAPDGSWAAWSVGDLALSERGSIDVSVAISESLPLSASIEIWDGIYDHLGNLADQVTTTFNIIHGEPDIDLHPIGLSIRYYADETLTSTLTITNEASATADLDWQLTEDPAADWIAESHTSGVLAPGNDDDVILSVDTTGLALGNYSTTLKITSNDPDESPWNVTISLEVICRPVETVTLGITNTGSIYTDTVVYFSADLEPVKATRPYTYIAETDAGLQTAPLTSTVSPLLFDDVFGITGTHAATITVWNCGIGGAVQDVFTFTVREQGACVDLTSVTIHGETSGAPGTYTFTTSYEPFDASETISYAWDDGGSASSSVRSLGVGTHTLTVTATNCSSAQVTDTHTIVIAEACQPITSVDFYWSPSSPSTTQTVTFTGTVTPPEAMAFTPWEVQWNFGDGDTASSNPAYHNFPVSSTYTVWFTASNACSARAVSHDVSVSGETFTPTYGVELTPATDAQSAAPESSAVYTLTVENSGDIADTFDLSYDDVNGWTSSVLPAMVNLAVGVTTEVIVTVDVPAAASGHDVVTVTATSQGDGAVSDSSVLTTTALWPKLYLPLVLKQ